MKHGLVLVVVALALSVAVAAPAFAVPGQNVPANMGLGSEYGGHISAEARAGTHGPELHPGMHHGFQGWYDMMHD